MDSEASYRSFYAEYVVAKPVRAMKLLLERSPELADNATVGRALGRSGRRLDT
jgi:hypothetical protein